MMLSSRARAKLFGRARRAAFAAGVILASSGFSAAATAGHIAPAPSTATIVEAGSSVDSARERGFGRRGGDK